MKNLFVIGTPLQLINAIEAIKYFDLSNNILVLLNMSKTKNREQIDEIVKLYNWEKIIKVKNGKGLNFFKYFSLVRDLKIYKYNKVFVAKLESISMAIVANVKKEKIFLLDDGAMTISIYEKYIQNSCKVAYKLKELKFFLLGLKIKIKDKINLFTYYGLEPVDGNEVVKNKMSYFKSKYKAATKGENDYIYFVGQPVNDLMSKELHRSIIEKIIIKYNKKMIYIPHRGESDVSLEHLKSIDNSLFEIKNLGMPIELYFLKNHIYPNHVLSFFSTALVTIELIYDKCNIYYIKIPENRSNEKRFSSGLRQYYEHIGSNKLIMLKDIGI